MHNEMSDSRWIFANVAAHSCAEGNDRYDREVLDSWFIIGREDDVTECEEKACRSSLVSSMIGKGACEGLIHSRQNAGQYNT